MLSKVRQGIVELGNQQILTISQPGNRLFHAVHFTALAGRQPPSDHFCVSPVLSSMLLVACGQSESDIVANAKTNAEAYAKNLGAGAKVLSCSSQDSDNNGYVSCDIQKGD